MSDSPGTPTAPAAGPGALEDERRARAAFLAHMRHELRTPVNAILGYSEMLLEDREELGEQVGADLEKIHDAGATLLALINEILAQSKIEESKVIDIDAFGAEMRHHLRTPASTVIGYAEMLLEEADGLGDEPRGDLERILTSGKKLLGLIEDIVQMFEVKHGHAELRVEASAEVQSLIRDVVNTLAVDPRQSADRLGGRILVVDDNETNRDVLGKRLKRDGYEVATAEDGLLAMQMMADEEFDLVLLDIMMPIINGYQVLERMKQDPRLRHLPVIMISALDDIDGIVRCIEMGAEDYLPKPFNPTILKARIGACLEKKRLRDREVLHLQQIQEEKKRADDLLHVILPDDVVDELKRTNQVRPRRREEVAVLFCDIAGFTPYCSTRQPEEILQNLQQLFELYEELAAKWQMYKIKTIGDSFMSTAGLIVPLDNPVENAVSCGLEMIAGAKALPAAFDVRVGIHVGPVMAGVVGRRQYLFDIWGDAVNTASRVESHGLKGAVCVSDAAWKRIAGRFEGESRGIIPVKGKGEMEIHRVLGRRGAPAG
ncbi:MAG: response regulator [Vicinamibacteria bacterium]|nr:response regulator [Vicinamibacteria bacterium]